MSTAVADRIKELDTALKTKVAANKELADTFKIEDGVVVVEPEQKAAFDKNMADIREIKGLIDGLRLGDDADRYLSGSDEDGSFTKAANAAAAQGLWTPQTAKTLGQMFVESDEFKSLQGGKAGANMATPFELKAANIGAMWRGMHVKDVYTDMPGGTPGSFGRVQRDPLVDRARRTSRVRDLFPVQQTDATVIEYFRVSGFTNNASTVAQRDTGNTAFPLKPQSALQFTGQQAPVRTIAHWEAAHRHALADEPQLRGIIDNELLYGLRLVEDAQILSGSGAGEDLHGILNTSGIQSYAWSDGETAPVPDTKADALRRAATLAFLSYYEPTGVVLHPNDWEDIELTKNTNGDYLLAVSIALGAEPRVWRMSVVDTPAMPEGTALVGSFGIGAQLYDREEANVRISESHADFFVRNAIVILAEERLALAVKRPESFVEVSFDSAPT
jgi:HK97 family phage major capsid protein